MSIYPDDTPINDLPLGMMRNALRRAGFETAGDLRAVSDAQFMMHPGLGRGALNKVRRALGRVPVPQPDLWGEAIAAALAAVDAELEPNLAPPPDVLAALERQGVVIVGIAAVRATKKNIRERIAALKR